MELLKLKNNKVKKKKRKSITAKEFDAIAQHVLKELRRRENTKERRELDKKIKEIDRQVAMRPKTPNKRNADGTKTDGWMSELELPNQRQALEMNNADARRLLWPDSGSWFEANAEMTDKFLRGIEDLALIAGDENETRSSVNQEIVNEIVEAFILNIHKSYNFRQNMDIINGEAIKYGVGVGRAKRVTTAFFSEELDIPQLVPMSLKDVYLDDNKYKLMGEGINLEGAVIRRTFMRWEDLLIASQKGSSNVDDPNGGWMSKDVPALKNKDDSDIELIEFEGDLIVSQSDESIYVPGAIVTIAVGGGSKASSNTEKKAVVVRFRLRKSKRSSYFLFPYHQEDMRSPYAVGPLIMGHPLQAAATMALNRSMDAAAFSTQPFIFWETDDPEFMINGGPVLYPGGSAPTTGNIQEFAPGDPDALFKIYLGLNQQYAELTGMTGARLGAQTSSHTTAFAKGQEVNRGQIRIVDYVKSVIQGPLSDWLQFCYEDARDALGKKEISIFMHKSRSFINLTKEALPANVFFDIFGASGPAEDAAKVGAQVQALQMALGIETAKRQLGEGDDLDLAALQKEILRKGGIIDVDKFYVSGREGVPSGAETSPDVGSSNGENLANAAPAAIQAILTQNRG